jgi:hypothetical protein
METSAKSSTNVEQAFMAMAAEIKNRYCVCMYGFYVGGFAMFIHKFLDSCLVILIFD